MPVSRLDACGRIQLIDIGPGRIDQHLAADLEMPSGHAVPRLHPPFACPVPQFQRLDVICRKTAMVQCRTDEAEDKARVVVEQVGVRVLESRGAVDRVDDRLHGPDGAGTQVAGGAGVAPSDQPVQPGPGPKHHRMVTETAGNRGQKPNLPDGGGKTSHQFVARPAQLRHEAELVTFHVLDPAPDQVGRMLAGQSGEIPGINQANLRAAGRQCRSAHGAVDAATDDQHVQGAAAKRVDVLFT